MNLLRYLILGTLRGHGPQHGYGVMLAYREHSGTRLNLGNVYREMRHLVNEGLARTVPNPPTADARRIPLQITGKGTAAFDAWLGAPAGARLGLYKDDLSARVTLLCQAEPSLRSRLIARWRDELGKEVQATAQAHDTARTQAHHDPSARCRALELSRRLRHLIADREFLDEVGANANGPLRAPTVPASRPIAPRTSSRTTACTAAVSPPGAPRRDG